MEGQAMTNSIEKGMTRTFSPCQGSGHARRHTDAQLSQIDALIDSIRKVQEAKRILREAKIDTGSGFNARGLL